MAISLLHKVVGVTQPFCFSPRRQFHFFLDGTEAIPCPPEMAGVMEPLHFSLKRQGLHGASFGKQRDFL